MLNLYVELHHNQLGYVYSYGYLKNIFIMLAAYLAFYFATVAW